MAAKKMYINGVEINAKLIPDLTALTAVQVTNTAKKSIPVADEDSPNDEAKRMLLSELRTIMTYGVKVYKALITVAVVSQDSGTLTVGKTYATTKLESGDNFANVGYVAENTHFVATGTTPTSWSNKTVMICITDSTPTSLQIANTLSGNPTFGYDIIIGAYMTLTGEFTVNKTFILSEYGTIVSKALLPDTLSFSSAITGNSLLIEVYP
jgi:hypothetical protein